ncbi:hypothetical protein M0C40_00235 [Spiroplasma citri]|uniref:DUF3688 domain-containing protein n=1 Tax=Spiroplasma citri TaxID=2133 RepID=A0AAX3SYT4_SPICI|nr:hypothetical protein [Spiroplasma citri]WFG96481.1 hypothetical protein M0C40_00235 [Spiroplasma citri]
MLSNYTYSKYAINKGYNDDVKLITPYYFELISTPNKIEDGYWEFKDCKVLLNSSYFNFSGGPTPPKNYWKEVYADGKPFNPVDNKYYFVVWHGLFKTNWKINKFNNNDLQHNKILDKHNECVLVLEFLSSHNTDLFIQENKYPNRRWSLKKW